MIVWLQHPLLVATLGQKLPTQQWERGSSVINGANAYVELCLHLVQLASYSQW